MSEDRKGESPDLEAWMLLDRTRGLILRCEDRVLSEFGLTTEQYTVLLAIKCLDEPVRATDVGRWVGHKVNTASTIIDRMVKAGLVSRMRDLPDRREIRVVITGKGEQAFRPARSAVSRLIEDIWSSLRSEDKRSLVGLLQMLRDRALEYSTSGIDVWD